MASEPEQGNVEVTRSVVFHLSNAGRDSMRGLAERLEQLSTMYKEMNSPTIAETVHDTADLIKLFADGPTELLLDVADGIHGYISRPGRA